MTRRRHPLASIVDSHAPDAWALHDPDPPTIPMHPLTYALLELCLNNLLEPEHAPERFVGVGVRP